MGSSIVNDKTHRSIVVQPSNVIRCNPLPLKEHVTACESTIDCNNQGKLIQTSFDRMVQKYLELQNLFLPQQNHVQEQSRLQLDRWIPPQPLQSQYGRFPLCPRFPVCSISVHTGDSHSKLEEIRNLRINNHQNYRVLMRKFPSNEIGDLKHVIYNLLVDNHNDPDHCKRVTCFSKNGRLGFQFNSLENPEKFVPEMYAFHLRGQCLEQQQKGSVLIQDLYKFYLRACVELLSKYFEKVDKWSYLYFCTGLPLFVPNEDLSEARNRLMRMKSRSRAAVASKKRKRTVDYASDDELLASPHNDRNRG